MKEFLVANTYIDAEHPEVLARASALAQENDSELELARACFYFVRDEIAHSGDIKTDEVTLKASDVLKSKTGWCFAKSHLLAALLRANGIPAALCYQRLVKDDEGAYTYHGFNSVLLKDYGWYRCDARGNKEGLNAQFTPPVEKLAWPGNAQGEINFSKRFSEPVPVVVECLSSSKSFQQVYDSLPDGLELFTEKN